MDNIAGTSSTCFDGSSKKRKQPDEDPILLREGPLTEPPIDNEYEHLDEEDECNDDETNLGRVEFERIKLAQEKATISRYGNIKVTPFNLDEELEEGQFDKAGNFIFKEKEAESDEDANDNWAESIDWDEVERKEGSAATRSGTSRKVNPEPTVIHRSDKASCYKEMLRIMRPDETVKKTIQRLGDSIPKRKPFNKNTKHKRENDALSESSEDKRRILDRMIELAHQRLEKGDMGIYQKSYEDLEEAIQNVN